jgi:hypothetical protein
MRCVAGVLLIAAASLNGQIIINPGRAEATLRKIQTRSLRCDVEPIKPTLNFGFRFQAGYRLSVPLNQYFGRGNVWAVLIRIAPEDGSREPVYLATRVGLPDVPKTDAHAEMGGGYLLGEGRYRAEWTLVDNQGRSCSKTWKIEAKLGRGERDVQVAIPRYTIAELSLRGAPKAEIVKADVRPLRLTVLLNAAPMSMRRSRMRPADTLMLIGTLSSLLERLPAKFSRLVVFNLDQQTELFREDGFTPERFNQVAAAMNKLELASVDINVLQNRRGHLDLLADLINQEIKAEQPSDVVIFLGPSSRYWDKLPRSEIEKPREAPPDFYYFRFQPSFFRRVATLPDSIQMAVSRLKGKTSVIYTPGEFARAIEQLETRVTAVKR